MTQWKESLRQPHRPWCYPLGMKHSNGHFPILGIEMRKSSGNVRWDQLRTLRGHGRAVMFPGTWQGTSGMHARELSSPGVDSLQLRSSGFLQFLPAFSRKNLLKILICWRSLSCFVANFPRRESGLQLQALFQQRRLSDGNPAGCRAQHPGAISNMAFFWSIIYIYIYTHHFFGRL